MQQLMFFIVCAALTGAFITLRKVVLNIITEANLLAVLTEEEKKILYSCDDMDKARRIFSRALFRLDQKQQKRILIIFKKAPDEYIEKLLKTQKLYYFKS